MDSALGLAKKGECPLEHRWAKWIGEYPLERRWDIWFNYAPAPSKPQRGKKAEPLPPKMIGSIGCAVTMWAWMSNIPPLKTLTVADSGLHIFECGIEPFWEDSANANGGRWMYSIPTTDDALADTAWQNLYLGLFGGLLDPDHEVTGIIIARRRAYTRFSVWTRNRHHDDAILMLGKNIKANLPADVVLEYQDHGAPFGLYRHEM